MAVADTPRYTPNTVWNYFTSVRRRRFQDLDYEWIDHTVVPYRDSYRKSGRVIMENNPPVIYGGFELDNAYDRSILGLQFGDTEIGGIASTPGAWYEYGAYSDINTIALHRGAKVGDNVRIHMYAINRKPILFDLGILQDENGRNFFGEYFLYPYRARDYLAGDANLPLNTVVNDESPLNTWTVAGFQDLYWGGWVSNQEQNEHQSSSDAFQSFTGCYAPYARMQPRIHNWSGGSSLGAENFRIYENAILGNQFFSFYTRGPYVNVNNLRQDGWPSDGGQYQSFNLGCLNIGAYKPYSTYKLGKGYYDIKTKVGYPLYQSINLQRIFGDNRGGTVELKLFTGTVQGVPPAVDATTRSVIVWMEKISSSPPIIPLTPTTTATPTNTPNQTLTPTSSKTATPTPTNTITPTRSPDQSATPTSTPTNTRTPRSTRIVSPTPTPTPSLSSSAPAITRGQLCVVRDINNPGYILSKSSALSFDGRLGVGRVPYPYCIGKYEVTNYEYCEFLNAVGQQDANNVYQTPSPNPDGGTIQPDGIQRSGALGSYTYSIYSYSDPNKPVNYISWLSAARYCNWLHKNKPNDPTGASVNTGAYDLTQYDKNKPNNIIKRSPGAKYWIPSIDEWIKAGYYYPTTGGYYAFGNQSDNIPDYGTGGDGTNSAVWKLQWFQGPQHVASFPNSVSYYGLNGISGNVKEYTDTFSNNLNNILVLGSSFLDQRIQPMNPTGLEWNLFYMINWGYSNLGFRIASTTGLTEQEQLSAIPPPPTPTPILSCKLTSENKAISLVHNQVCSYRFFVKSTPIKDLYGGLSLDTEDVKRLKTMGINFANRQDAESLTMPGIKEYRVDSDLNSIALHMGAKNNDYVELEVNYVWRGHSIYIREDNSGLADVIPYGSYNPFFGKDFFRKYVNGSNPGQTDGWKNIRVEGAAPSETIYSSGKREVSGWDSNKNLLPADNFFGLIAVPYYKFGILNISEHDLDSITDIKLAYDPIYIQQYGSNGIKKLFSILTKDKASKDTMFNESWNPNKTWYNLSIELMSGTSFNGNYKTINEQKSTVVGPLSTDVGFTIPVGDGYWIGLQDSYLSSGLERYRSISRDTYGALEAVQYLFNEWLKSSPYGLVRQQIINSLETNIAETQRGLATSINNKDNITTQNLNKKLSDQQAELTKIKNTSASTNFGQYTMLVRMTKQPPPPPPPSASPTPSSSRLGDINNQIFATSPNYQSAFSDENHLQQYISNPFMNKLKSTTNDSGVAGLIPNTRYLINSTIEGRKVTYQKSNAYTIETWKNNITTIKFDQPAQQQANVTIKYRLEDETTDRNYTVTILKLKKVIDTFDKTFWFGGTIKNYAGDLLQNNSTYKKYITELSKYRFKAYYRLLSGPDKNVDTWIPIGSDTKETTLTELDTFSSNYQSQILIRSNNLNNDILFPKEGTPANPGYTNDSPTFFNIDVKSRSIELRSVGANSGYLSSKSVEPLKKTGPTSSGLFGQSVGDDTYAISLYKNFDKQIELLVNCWSPTENKFVNFNGSSNEVQFTITNVTGCKASAVTISSQDKIGYDTSNPNNCRAVISFIGDPFDQNIFDKLTGKITVSCTVSSSAYYQGETKTIVLTWSILSQKDKISVSSIGPMYTGDPANAFTITLDSDQSSPKKIKTVTVSDRDILSLTNIGDSYLIRALPVDVTKASILQALKSAYINISVPGNSYWLPTETTIPLTIYPNNARLQRATPKKYAYLTSGLSHFLGITGDGVLHVWGKNINGVFASSMTTTGVNDNRGLVNIIDHPNKKKWIQVESYGYNVYAIDIDGDLWGWGLNSNASLGVGRDGQINTPTRISSNLKWKDIACGMSHAIGLTQDGKVYGWGDGSFLQNGCGTKSGDIVNVSVPTLIDVTKLSSAYSNISMDAIRVSCGPYSSWVVDKSNYLWGFGDLNGMLTSQATFPISTKPGALEINSMANPSNELNTLTTGYYAPLTHHTINFSRNVAKLKSSEEYTVFPVENSRKYKWNPHRIRNAVGYGLISNVANISSSANHVMVVYDNNTLTSWGNNIWNQCFTTSPANKYYVYVGQSVLVDSVLGEDGTFMAASPGQSMYIDKNNKLCVIGRNNDNELSGPLSAIAADWYTWSASKQSSYFQTAKFLPGKYISLTSNGTESFIETAPSV